MCTASNSSNEAPIVMYRSMILPCLKGIGVISQLMPNTNKMLKILDHTMLPTAISDLPLSQATTDVTNSGNDVPIARTVSQIILSDIP